MPKIQHIDDMKIEDFIKFAKDLSENTAKYEFSEKVDGQNFSIGFEDEKFYTKTKRSPKVLNDKFYKGIPHCIGFYDLHKNLSKQKVIIHNIKENLNTDNFQVFVEILPFSQTNNIDYKFDDNKKHAILFDVYSNDNSIISNLSPIDIRFKILDELNRLEGWIFYYKNIIKSDKIHFHNLRILTFIYLTYKDVLKSRKKEHKILKGSIKKIIKQSKLSMKEMLLEKFKNQKPLLGNSEKMEGIIMRNKETNESVKLVDKEGFTEENEKQQGINREIGLENKWFYKEIRSIFNDHDALTNKEKMKEKISEELFLRRGIKILSNRFHNLNDVLGVIIGDLKEENNLQLSENELLDKLKEIFSKYQKNIRGLHSKWKKNIKSEQAPIPKKVSRRKFDKAYNRIRVLNKLIFHLESDNPEMDKILLALIKLCISDSTLEKLKEEFIWEA